MDFALSQISQCLRNKNETKAKQWAKAITGIYNGSIRIGSRQPTDAPIWVTPQVLHGGFASGTYLAELCPEDTSNDHYLTEEGATELMEQLDNGLFRITVPEHAAIPTVLWLVREGRMEEARKILNEIHPWFDRLRFYPEKSACPMEISAMVSLNTGQEIACILKNELYERKNIHNPVTARRIALERAHTQWNPLKWKVLRHFCRTCECEHMSGWHPDCPRHTEKGCGWPCHKYPEEWMKKAREHLESYDALVRSNEQGKSLNSRRQRKGTLYDLIKIMRKIVTSGPKSLSGKEVGRVRQLLRDAQKKRGLPHTDRFKKFWEPYAKMNFEDENAKFYPSLIQELGKYRDGVPTDVIETITNGLPTSLQRRAERARLAYLDDHLNRGSITSAESLAGIVPGLVAATTAPGDPTLARIHYGLVQAFSARRSLLLLNLEKQVRRSELPWYLSDRAVGVSDRVLKQITHAALTYFPYTITPNPLLNRLRDLQGDRKIPLILVDEIAADIFMGSFSDKFAKVAIRAAELLKGTLYERYYGLASDWHMICQNPSSFAEVCQKRAASSNTTNKGYVARNGRVIEQSQILTTHNLATLVPLVNVDSVELALKIWDWIRPKMGITLDDYHAELQRQKNIGYAWRQMVFHLSIIPEELARKIEFYTETESQRCLFADLWSGSRQFEYLRAWQ